MPSQFLRPFIRCTTRATKTTNHAQSPFSTQRPSYGSYRSKPFLAVASFLVVGVPVAFTFGKNYNRLPKSEVKNNLGALYEGSLEWKGKIVPPCTMDEVEAWLVKEQSVHEGVPGSGVREWHCSRRPSNTPGEDDLVIARVWIPTPPSGESEPWMFWGVFDGHVGSATSAVLRESLVPYIARSLSQLFRSPLWCHLSKDEQENFVVDSIKSSFNQIDDEILSDGIDALETAKTHTEALSRLAPGFAGACALLSIYDPNSNILRVACTGDCRAVLGSFDSSTKNYVTTPLSIDQTGFNKSELERIRREHPGEIKAVNEENGRVLGMMPTRTFGDGVWKWPKEVVKECYDHFWSWKPRDGYLTPPYLTAEPIITTTKIERKGEFIILATDGLWDCMSNEQAVKLVEMWLKTKEGTLKRIPKKEQKESRLAMRIEKKRQAKEEDFVVLDDNCATHLVRNALGGGDEEVICGLVGAAPSFSREARDDITVQVIFFDGR